MEVRQRDAANMLILLRKGGNEKPFFT